MTNVFKNTKSSQNPNDTGTARTLDCVFLVLRKVHTLKIVPCSAEEGKPGNAVRNSSGDGDFHFSKF